MFGELGASYNGWSLSPNEEPNSHSIEFIGQTFDSMQPVAAETQQRLQFVGDMFNEYLAFCNVINELLLRRHRVHVSFELCSETLGQKKALLAQLEQSEEQTQRLGAVLAVEGQPSIPLSRPSGILASFNALIDNDPDTARRNNISKTRAIITSLESEREERRIVLLNLNTEIDSSLNYFQSQKIKDFRNGLVRLCKAMKEDCEQNLKFWAECQKVVNNA